MELLAVQLKQDAHCTVKELARQHGVSPRTITRDLSVMRDQGMQIDGDRGRGGGLRLDRNWGVGRLNLSHAEAVDLLISIAVSEQMKSPMFLANLGSVKRQLIASFSPEKRRQVSQLKSRILIGITASTYVQASVGDLPVRIIQEIHQAFVGQEILEIEYQREDGKTSSRTIEPHFLMLKYPVWYILAHDHLHNEPRTFRCDRVLSASRSQQRFNLLPKSQFESHLAFNDDPE